jgi:hypothetical protein
MVFADAFCDRAIWVVRLDAPSFDQIITLNVDLCRR